MKVLLTRLVCIFLLLTSTIVAGEINRADWDHAGDDELRLLEVILDNYVMDDILAAFQYKGQVMVPLGVLSQMLGFAIEVKPESATAEGFILSDERRFFLDVQRGEVTLFGNVLDFDVGRVRVETDDLYIDAELLSQWLPIKLDIDLFVMEARVLPQQPLPLQLRLERERRIAKTRLGFESAEPEFPRYEVPYQLWSMPFVDQNLQLGMRQDPVGVATRELQYTTYASADALYHESSLYLAGTDEDFVEDYRLTLGRKNPYAELLGPLRATEYQFGHVEAAAIDLVAGSKLPQPGLVLGNYPLRQQAQYDSHSFSGELLPGWEVELYHNNALLGYQSVSANGLYSFNDMPLLFGNNYFRLVFYGPQGQVREEQMNFVLDESLTRAGEHHYQLSLNQDDNDDLHASIKYDVGLSKHLSAQVALVSLPLDEIQNNYQSLAVRGFGSGLFYGVNLVNNVVGGQVREAFVQTRLGGINLGLSDAHLEGFVSEIFPQFGEPLSRHSQVRLDSAIPPSFLPRIPVTLEIERNEFESGRSETRVRNRLTVQSGGLALGNDVSWSMKSSQQALVNGNVMLSQFAGRYSLRGDIYYTLEPDAEIGAAIVSFNSQYFSPYNLRLVTSRSFVEGHNQYTAEVNKRVDGYTLSLNASYISTGDSSIQLVWSMNFGREPRTPFWLNSERPLATRGAISARAFLDKDRDGVMSEGDEALEGVGFTIGSGYRVENNRTDTNGVAFIASVPASRPLNIRLASHTLNDPLWAPASEGWQIVPRPGLPIQLDFAVLETGEIDGSIYLVHEEQTKGLGGIEVELVDPQGQVVKTVRTGFDGYYLMSNIPPGEYRLRIVPGPGRQFAPDAVLSKGIEFTSEQQYFYDFDFILRPLTETKPENQVN